MTHDTHVRRLALTALAEGGIAPEAFEFINTHPHRAHEIDDFAWWQAAPMPDMYDLAADAPGWRAA